MKEIILVIYLIVFNDGRPDEVVADIQPDMVTCVEGITVAQKLISMGDVPPGVEGIYMECKKVRPIPISRFKNKKYDDA